MREGLLPSSGKLRSTPVIRMILSTAGRTAVSLTGRPVARECAAICTSARRPRASQKDTPPRSTVTVPLARPTIWRT